MGSTAPGSRTPTATIDEIGRTGRNSGCQALGGPPSLNTLHLMILMAVSMLIDVRGLRLPACLSDGQAAGAAEV